MKAAVSSGSDFLEMVFASLTALTSRTKTEEQLLEAHQVAPPKIVTFMTVVGVALYGGVGVANLALGGNYLDYNTLSHDVAHGQHIGIILVELGVGITVTSVMLNLFYLFAGYKGVAKK